MAAKVQVIFYSTYGHVYRLAEAIVEGARSVAGTDVQLFQVAETLSAEILAKMGATEAKKAFAHIPIADSKRLPEADAIILGTPTRYGSATAQMQAFIDSTGSLWGSGALIGKLGSAFTSTASQHGGQETTLLSMMLPLLHHGMLVIGLPYTQAELNATRAGGTPYGASHFAGLADDQPVSDDERTLCIAQGRRLAGISLKLCRA